jgi:hypothetical protein
VQSGRDSKKNLLISCKLEEYRITIKTFYLLELVRLTLTRRGKRKNASQIILCIHKINSNKACIYDRHFAYEERR